MENNKDNKLPPKEAAPPAPVQKKPAPKKVATPASVSKKKQEKKPETVEHEANNKTTATKKPIVDGVDTTPGTEKNKTMRENASLLGRLRRAIGENKDPQVAQKPERLRKYRFAFYHAYHKESNSSAQIFNVNPKKEPGKDPFKVVHSKNNGSEDTVTYHPDQKSAYKHVEKVLHSVKEEVEPTNEAVLNLSQRIKRAQIMRREAPKIERAREISRTRFARDSQLKNRAEALARRLVKKKFAGERGYDYQKLSTSEKMAIDAMVDKKVALIHTLAKRLYPVVRRKEVARMLALHKGVGTTPGASPVNIVNSYTPEMEIVEKTFAPVSKDKESGIPEKYKGSLSSRVAKARKAHWNRTKEMDPSNPEAYEPAPGDATSETKPSKYTKKYKKMFGESDGPVVWSKGNYSIEKIGNKFALYDGKKKTQEFSSLDLAKKTVGPLTEQISGLKKKAEKSGISYGTLKKVYDRGMAAWRTGHRPGTTPQQWAFARVNSFITKGKTYHTADKDLREETELNEWYIDTASKYKPSRGDSIVTTNGGRVFGRVERVDEVSVYFRSQNDNRVYKTEINNVSKVDHWDGTLNENHSPECSDYEPPKKKTLLKRIKDIKEAQRDADFEMEKYVDASRKTRFRKIRKIDTVDKEEGEG